MGGRAGEEGAEERDKRGVYKMSITVPCQSIDSFTMGECVCLLVCVCMYECVCAGVQELANVGPEVLV